MRWVKFFVSLAITLLITILLSQKIGQIPPLGHFLNPLQGFWQNAERPESLPDSKIVLRGIQGEITVLYDERMVPHIFADNFHDLFFAQGYITASQRLWQMELQVYLAAGRLSEIFGSRTLDVDRYFRRLGMGLGAEASLRDLLANPESKTIIEAYSKGINAFISGLDRASLPFEYKLLDYRPERWEPLKTTLLAKYLGYQLAVHT